MPTVVLSNSIGQPTTEVQAQTQKVRFSPVTVNNEGSVSQSKELPVQSSAPETPVKVQETAPEPAAPKAKDPKQMQDEERFAAIVRREKAMRAKVREHETELAQYKSQVAELAEIKRQAEELKQQETLRAERMKLDPIGYMTEQGFSSDQITEALLNQPGPESRLVKSLEAKILKLEQDRVADIKRQEELEAKNYKTAISTVQRNVEKLVTNNPEFEMINANDASKSVTTYIEKVWKEEGIALEAEEAAKEIEDYLLDQTVAAAKLKKVQQKIGLQPKPATPKQVVPPAAKPVTLTNKVASNTRPLSARERAILAFKRELK